MPTGNPILDMFGINAPMAPGATPINPTPDLSAAAPNQTPNYDDYRTNLLNAARAASAAANAHPGTLSGLWGWISGRQRDAMVSAANAAAPGDFEKYAIARNAAQAGELQNAQALAAQGANMGGYKFDPNNIMSSLPDMIKAYTAVLGNNNAPSDSSAPATAAPPSAPAAPSAPAFDPNKFAGVTTYGGGLTGNAANAAALNPDFASRLQAMFTDYNGLTGKKAAFNSGARTAADQQAMIDRGYPAAPVGASAHENGTAADSNTADVAAMDRLGLFQKYGLAHGTGDEAHHIFMAGSAPQAAPSAAPAAPQADALQRQRAFLMSQARLHQMMGDAQGAMAYMNAANNGKPDNTTVLPNGQVGEGVTGAPITMTGQQYNAQGAAMNAAGAQRGTNVETRVPVMTNSGQTTISADQDLHGGAQGTDANGRPNYLPIDSPAYKAILDKQTADLKATSDDAATANTGLDTAMNLFNAANGLYTGKGAETLQNWRKIAQGIHDATGINVDPNVTTQAAAFEQLRYAALNFVQSAAHAFSPRAAQMIVKMIAAAKPGDETSPQGLKAIITNEVMPAFMRQRAMYGATQNYYSKNRLAQDAQAVVPNKVPLSNFGVRDVHSAQPGDYYIDPISHNLRQRPVQ